MTFKAIHGMPPDYICRLINPKPLTNYALRSNRKFLLNFFVLNAFYICEAHLIIFMKFELYKFLLFLLLLLLLL